MKTLQRLQVGIIGCGDISVSHAEGIKKARNAEIGMVMDVSRKAAKGMGKRYEVPFTTELDELFSNKKIDAVYIATPHNLHMSITIKAAKAGKHVMVEKPIAISLKQAEQMITECKKAKVVLSVCFVLRYAASIMKARELIKQGAIGKVIGVRISAIGDKPTSYWKGGFSGRVKTDWRMLKAKSGGGILIMNASHNIDTFRYVTGLEVERIFSEYDTFVTPVEVEDMISATFRCNNGAIGSIEAGSCVKGGEFGKIHGDRIYGTKGQIILSTPLRIYISKKFAALSSNKWHELKIKESGNLRTKYVEEFAKAVFSGKKPSITGKDGRKSLEIVLAAYTSVEKQIPVHLPLRT